MDVKTAFITGASSGIGYDLAKLMASKGYKVLATGRREERLKKLKEETGENLDYVVADLSNKESVKELVKAVREHFNHLDVLVNNAGFAVAKPVLKQTDEELEGQFLVNTIRPLQLIKGLLDTIPSGGVIVNVVTSGVHVILYGLPIYGAFKIALFCAGQVLRCELREKGITLVEVFPGPVKTEFFTRAGIETPSLAVSSRSVAKVIFKAIEKKKEKVYIPLIMHGMRIFSPLPFHFL
ncbi:MAG: oxidoreductase [Thermoprotei archaeon]|nr:MAG: oxidoreductase [Thermoprotei archaeon]